MDGTQLENFETHLAHTKSYKIPDDIVDFNIIALH